MIPEIVGVGETQAPAAGAARAGRGAGAAGHAASGVVDESRIAGRVVDPGQAALRVGAGGGIVVGVPGFGGGGVATEPPSVRAGATEQQAGGGAIERIVAPLDLDPFPSTGAVAVD